MKDVLDVYQRPRDPLRLLVTLDAAGKQLVADVTSPVSMQPGRPARQDYEYEAFDITSSLLVPRGRDRHVFSIAVGKMVSPF